MDFVSDSTHEGSGGGGLGGYADAGLDGGFDVGHYPPVTPGTSYVI